MRKTFIIAEIGINANGSVDIAKQLIDGAVKANCNAVKFQKRTIDVVYAKEELDKPRESPWGTTNREQKYGLEFESKEYDIIDAYCKEKGIDWFASAWDMKSQKFLRQYNLKYNKIASAMLTHKKFLKEVAKEGKHTFISTGGSTLKQIEDAVEIFYKENCSFELMHCNSSYPMKNEDANLETIAFLRDNVSFGRGECLDKIGYSDHSTGRVISMMAVALGATSIERHITLDKTMYGSDQAASLEINDLCRLTEDIETVEKAIGTYDKFVTEKEEEIMKKLRRVK